MTLAVAILAHTHLHRVANIARYLTSAGVHVAIHVDEIVSPERLQELQTSLSSCENIIWPNRTKCEWGEFSLVEATLTTSAAILERWADVSHVMLISGETLPIRTPEELEGFLDQHPETDFIESVAVNENRWVMSGLGIERFTLYFPFSWKNQRWLFDTWVNLQRKFGIRRRPPSNLSLHIGSQWWCLTRRTLSSILADPEKTAVDAYFQKCWIPDEAYFQTLARKHSSNIESRSLVFSRFDHQGKPTVFYDDHAPILSDLDAFFVRKVWHGANKLYNQFTTIEQKPSCGEVGLETANDMISRVAEQRKSGRAGLHMQGRAPCRWHESQMATAAPYSVFSGLSAIFPNFNEWLERQVDVAPHGRIFAADQINFSKTASVGPGGLSTNILIRDLAPDAFLCNLVWNTRKEKLAFHYEGIDENKISAFLQNDPHANIYHIRHSWVIELMERDITNVDYLLNEANRLVQHERAFNLTFSTPKTMANVHVWSIGEVLSSPTQILTKIVTDIGREPIVAPILLPEMPDTSKLVEFGQTLKNIGVDLDALALETSFGDIQQSKLHVTK